MSILPGDFSKQVGHIQQSFTKSVNNKLSKLGLTKARRVKATKMGKQGVRLSRKGAKSFCKQVGKAIGFGFDVAFGGSGGGPADPTDISLT